MKTRNLQKYVAHYAEPEARLKPPTKRRYCAAFMVPVCGEVLSFLERWRVALSANAQLAENPLRPLVVLVVNADASTSGAFKEQNQQLLSDLVREGAVRLDGPSPAWFVARTEYDIVAIDRSTGTWQLPLKSGVGLARKIGGDIVCAWYLQGVILQPWWLSTDADVTLPTDIVERLMNTTLNAGVACLPFEHVSGGEYDVDAATFAVEVKLRYHVLGMRYAQSPYAWHALGSCLAIHTETYAAVRGFPKRLAGEDFYFLQKASKVAPVIALAGEPVRIVARRSQRTPFGTGREVSILEGNVADLQLRNPESYVCLKHVLALLNAAVQSADQPRIESLLGETSDESTGMAIALQRQAVVEGWRNAMRGATTPKLRQRRLHEWFDGLRTIQLLNALQATMPALTWQSALKRAPFVPQELTRDAPDFGTLAARLRKLEAMTSGPRGRGAATT